jgi:hypothetical protein
MVERRFQPQGFGIQPDNAKILRLTASPGTLPTVSHYGSSGFCVDNVSRSVCFVHQEGHEGHEGFG